MQGNYILALAAGVIATIVGAAIWAVITISTGYQIGWMAVGVGFLVGMAMSLGRGSGVLFGFTGAVLALAGCIMGNLLSAFGFFADENSIPIVEIIMGFDYTQAPAVLMEMAQPIDALFYGLAIFQGAKFATSNGEEPDIPSTY